MEFFYDNTVKTLLIGSKKGRFKTATFNKNRSFIGFYGTQATDHIVQLGFLVQDIDCSFKALDTSDDYQPEGNMTGLYVMIGGGAGSIALFTLLSWYLICKRKKEKLQVIDQSKVLFNNLPADFEE